MKLCRCPLCHCEIHLDALVQDEAARGLLGLLAGLDAAPATALVMYLGLFRSKSRNLANDRALRLAREVLALGGGGVDGRLEAAMVETAQAIRAKQGTPLRDHAYLERVYKNMPHPAVVAERGAMAPTRGRPAPPKSATLGALEALEVFKRGG